MRSFITIKNIIVGLLLLLFVGIIIAGSLRWEDYNNLRSASKDIREYEKVVAITFDDGPGYKTTMKLLEGLRERNVKATFFVVGENIEKRKSVLEQIQKDGHLIGNHTYSHIQLGEVNEEYAISQIIKTNELIENITGKKVEYIRPPFGSITESLEEKIDMTTVLWTLDTMDWNTTDVRSVVDYVVDNVKGYDIILMHDVYDTSVTAALEIIDILKSRGYMFVTVDDLLLE